MLFIAYYAGYFAVFHMDKNATIAGTKGTARLSNFLVGFRSTHADSFQMKI